MRRFALGETVIELVQGDITTADTEAIANAANAMLMGGGGVDGAIHRAAGPQLQDALREVKRGLSSGTLPTGKAVITPGFRLSARYVIHCVGPIYSREGERASELLASCYREALGLCLENQIRSIAFPSISTGVYGYPVEQAAPIAVVTLRHWIQTQSLPRLCRFVLFDPPTLAAYEMAADKLFG